MLAPNEPTVALGRDAERSVNPCRRILFAV